MEDSQKYIDLYSGTEVEVLRLKNLLEEEQIPVLVQNDFQSGNLGGFFGGTPSTIRLKVRKADFDKAESFLKNY